MEEEYYDAVLKADQEKRKAEMAYTSLEFFRQVRKTYGLEHMTTGFAAIALFSNMFTRHVTLLGYDFYGGGTGHYYENAVDACGRSEDDRLHSKFAAEATSISNAFSWHDSKREGEIMNEMIQRKVVSVLHSSALSYTRDEWKAALPDNVRYDADEVRYHAERPTDRVASNNATFT